MDPYIKKEIQNLKI